VPLPAEAGAGGAPAGHSSSTSSSGLFSSSSSSGGAFGGLPEFVAASPLDAVAWTVGSAGNASRSGAFPSNSISGGSGNLSGLLATAADYSTTRVHHMRQLLVSRTPTVDAIAAASGVALA